MSNLFAKIVKGFEILLDALFHTLLDCLKSKKFIAVIAGTIAISLANYGIVLSPDDITAVLTIFSTYIGGQSIVDFKHASTVLELEKLKAESLKLEIEKLNLLKESNKNV